MMRNKAGKVFFILFLLLAIVAGGAYAYIKTDLFKTDKELFFKYLKKNVASIEEINTAVYEKIEENTEGKNYETSGTIKSKALKEMLTLDKELSIAFTVKADVENENSEANYMIKYGSEDLLGFNYLRNGDLYGLKSDEITNEKYLVIENKNLKELFTKFGMEDVSEIPDRIETNTSEDYKIDEKTSKEIKERYLGILNDQITEDKYFSEKDVAISVEGENVIANKYYIKITSKDMYNLFHELLTTLKDDETTLNVIVDIAKSQGSEITLSDAKEQCITFLESLEADEADFTEEESRILAVYTVKGKTIRTELVNENQEGFVYTISKKDNIDILRIEAISKAEKGNIEPGSIATILVESNVTENEAELTVTAGTEFDKEDLAELEANDDYSYYAESYVDSKLIFKYKLSNATEESYDTSFKATLNDSDIMSFTAKTKFGTKYDIKELTDSNSINLSTCSDSEFNSTMSSVSSQAVLVILQKANTVVPGLASMFMGSTLDPQEDEIRVYDSISNETIETDLNNALKKCQDEYVAAYVIDGTADVTQYLNQEKVAFYCEYATDVEFTESGTIKYTAEDGSAVEVSIQSDPETGYILVNEIL